MLCIKRAGWGVLDKKGPILPPQLMTTWQVVIATSYVVFSFQAASQDKFCLAIGQGITSNMAAEKHVGNR